jgi:parallel beta-helix repeat protein
MSGSKQLTAAQIVLALMCAIGSARVQAATYYVATTGLDTNAGTLASPFKTIKRGSQQLAAGDTLYIRAGTYNEIMMDRVSEFIFRNGTPGAYTRYAAYPGEEKRVVLRPDAVIGINHYAVWFSIRNSYIELSGLAIDGANTQFAALRTDGVYASTNPLTSDGYAHSHHIRIINNEFRNTGNGSLEIPANTQGTCVYLAGDNEFIGNYVHNCTSYGVYAYFDKGLIEGNVIHNTGRYALHLYSTEHTVNDWIIRNNRFYDNGIRGTLKTTLEHSASVIITRGRNNRVYNNLVYNSYGGVRVWGNADNTLVANNTIYGNVTYGIKVDGATNENTRIVNNISWGNPDGQIVNEGTNTTIEGNNLTSNPGVVNAAGADFHLLAGSPAINAGANLYSLGVTKDFAGIARPQTGAFEIGAYEYGSAPAPVAFNFSLSNGGNKTVTQGSSVTNSLTATLVSGAAQAVSLSVSGLPSGVTGSFSPASCTPNCTTVLTLSASASAATGNAMVTVTAVGGGVTKTSAFTLTVNAATPPPPPPPSGGPVGWWKLDETSGQNLINAAGGASGVLGASSAAETSDPIRATGRIGNALQFDGVDDRADLGISSMTSNMGAFTYAAWIRPAGWGGAGYGRIASRASSIEFYSSGNSSNTLRAIIYSTAGAQFMTTAGKGAIALNAWQHVAVSYDDAGDRKAHLYVNGVEATYIEQPALTGLLNKPAVKMMLGNREAGDRAFNGLIDEAQVYNRALSAAEVLALFNAAPSGSVTDINGDGITNVTDIQIAVNQAAGGAACGSGDVNKDGVCNVADVQLVVNRSLGL